MKKCQLTNRDISNNCRGFKFYLMLSDFQAAFAYWTTSQNPNDEILSNSSLRAYTEFLEQKHFTEKGKVLKFNYLQLSELICEDVFATIPEVLALNEMGPDFIDLNALARNVFYMVCREQITQQGSMQIGDKDLEKTDREELIRLIGVYKKAAKDSSDFHKASIAENKRITSHWLYKLTKWK